MTSCTSKNHLNSGTAKICGEHRELSKQWHVPVALSRVTLSKRSEGSNSMYVNPSTEGSTGGTHVDVDNNEEEPGAPKKPELINLLVVIYCSSLPPLSTYSAHTYTSHGPNSFLTTPLGNHHNPPPLTTLFVCSVSGTCRCLPTDTCAVAEMGLFHVQQP
ncbi:hypothetical protein BDZ97DRAFT_1818901 [Flammula alnicola]|nr:hypothetical protein BDZ97DRAFT_1818901 [Flammula alnicola]